MPRRLRPLFADAMYHVYSRTRPGLMLFENDDERQLFLKLLAGTVNEREWRCLAYCLMDTHFHLVVQTPDADLDAGMHRVLSTFAARLNRARESRGTVFGDRYGSTVIRKDSQLAEVVRYVALNPVRAGMCAQPSDWPWSSHLAAIGRAGPGFLALDELHDLIGAMSGLPRPDGYLRLVESAVGAEAVTADLAGPPALPSERPPLAEAIGDGTTALIAVAHWTHGYSLRAIAGELGLNASTVSRRLRRFDQRATHGA